MKYLLRLETNVRGIKKEVIKDWHKKLTIDTLERLDGYTWEYKTRAGVINRLKKLSGREITKDSFILNDELYGKQKVEVRLPGLATGYVDLDTFVDRAEKKGAARIRFKDFYDIRVSTKEFNLGDCYIILTVMEDDIDVPREILSTKGYRGVTEENKGTYCVIMQYAPNDFSFWLTEDLKDTNTGFSSRGPKEDLVIELQEDGFNKSAAFLDKMKKKQI